VDWEYSGISDPAFDIADVCSHAAYITVPLERWQWVIEAYCRTIADSACAERIRVYRQTLVMWWVIRFAQYLYEIPRGLDPRLAERAADWQADTQRKYAHYAALADRLFNE
jgi:thiamine kinase-like enzyme